MARPDAWSGRTFGASRRGFDQAVVAVVAQVQHLPSSVSRIDEIEEAVVEHVHLVPRLGERDRLLVAARLGTTMSFSSASGLPGG